MLIPLDRLNQNGYIFFPELRCEESTISIAQSIGSVIDIGSLLPGSKIPSVQVLKPRIQAASLCNRYSGIFGRDEFPLHTDLAHWSLPPRYFVLRCLIGSPTVTTKILNISRIFSQLSKMEIDQALVRPRRIGLDKSLCLLPLVFKLDENWGFRWDSQFLIPMNKAANRVAETICTQESHLSESLTLEKNGDTLIVDNWRVLHGRSKVSISDNNRHLERVYLSEIRI